MGGDIGVNSIENQGSDFWFNCRYLKVDDNDPIEEVKDEIVYDQSIFSKARLMVVEDNPIKQEILIEKLHHWLG